MKKGLIFFAFLFLLVPAISNAQTADSADKEFTKVEKEAKFPGGLVGWRNYLVANLNADLGNKYIKIKKGEKLGQQTVKLQFLVDKEGNVSNITVMNKSEVHPKLAAEGIRVIKEGPKWEPAEQGGKKVIYQAIQSITWQSEIE